MGSPLLVEAGPGSGKTEVVIERVKFLTVLFEQYVGSLRGGRENAADFFINYLSSVFAEVSLLVHVTAEEGVLIGCLAGKWPDSLAHAPV